MLVSPSDRRRRARLWWRVNDPCSQSLLTGYLKIEYHTVKSICVLLRCARLTALCARRRRSSTTYSNKIIGRNRLRTVELKLPLPKLYIEVCSKRTEAVMPCSLCNFGEVRQGLARRSTSTFLGLKDWASLHTSYFQAYDLLGCGFASLN
jgi:hypothetical protein